MATKLTPEEEAELAALEQEEAASNSVDLTPEEEAELAQLESEQIKSVPPAPEPDYSILDIPKNMASVVGSVSEVIDEYTGAPVRGYIDDLSKGKLKSPFGAMEYPRDPKTVPSLKDFAGRLGISEEDSIETNLRLDPFDRNKTLKVSPAGAVAGVAGTLVDPTTYMGGLPFKAGEKVAGAAIKAGDVIGDFAAERAVRAVTGHSQGGLEKMGRIPKESPNAVERTLKNIRERGRTLMRADEAGEPVVGWFSGPRKMSMDAAKKREYYGNKIGQTDKVVDRLVPEGISRDKISEDYMDYARSLQPIGEERDVISPVVEEAMFMENLDIRDPITGGEFYGPHKNLTVERTRGLKGKYPFNPKSSKPLETNKSARNRMRQGLQDQIDNNLDIAKSRAVSEEDIALLNSAEDTNNKFGMYKDAETLSAVEGVRSPTFSLNILADMANKIAFEKGPAFTARTADGISRMILGTGTAYNKYVMPFQKAAKLGNAGVVALHQMLMNNDPEYRENFGYSSDAEEGSTDGAMLQKKNLEIDSEEGRLMRDDEMLGSGFEQEIPGRNKGMKMLRDSLSSVFGNTLDTSMDVADLLAPESYGDLAMPLPKSLRGLSSEINLKNIPEDISPKAKELLQKLLKDKDIKISNTKEMEPYTSVELRKGSDDVASFDFREEYDYLKPTDSMVKSDFRRNGIASDSYQLIEELFGKKLVRGDIQTKAGKSLWDNPNRKFGDKKREYSPEMEVINERTRLIDIWDKETSKLQDMKNAFSDKYGKDYLDNLNGQEKLNLQQQSFGVDYLDKRIKDLFK